MTNSWIKKADHDHQDGGGHYNEDDLLIIQKCFTVSSGI